MLFKKLIYTGLSSLMLLAASPLTASAAAASATASLTPPAALQKSQQAFQLDHGRWLSLDKNALRLLASDGTMLAQYKIRAKHLDLRRLQSHWVALSFDADNQQTVVLQIDAAAGSMREAASLPAPPFSLETSCLYLDQQSLLQVFLIGKEGISQQWLLEPQPRLIRQLALPPHAEQCLSDDSSGRLLLTEQSGRVWSYRADPEGPLQADLLLSTPAAEKHGQRLLALRDGQILIAQAQKQWLWHAALPAQLSALPPLPQPQRLSALMAATDSTVHAAWWMQSAQANAKIAATQPVWQRRTSPVIHTAVKSAPLPVAIVMPLVQTASMQQYGDSADDPAIWRNAGNPAESRVLGTNKKFGLMVYDMQGQQTQALATGRLNNVDVRQQVRFGADAPLDLAMATQRDENSLVLFQISAEGKVSEAARFNTPLDKIYGFCLYQPVSGGLQAIVNDKDGRFLQYRIDYQNNRFSAELVRQFRTASQPEACVADDKRGQLFIGEEKRGIWVLPAAADASPDMQLIHTTGKALVADTEGLALYHGEQASYLLVSSQGDHSYLVLDAAAPYRLRGKFRIGIHPQLGIDGTSETDGIEVTSANMGGAFAQGMLVVQDGYKRLPDGQQNFKYVPWSAIREALNLP